MRAALVVLSVMVACTPAPPVRAPQPELTEAQQPPMTAPVVVREAAGGSDIAPGGMVTSAQNTNVELASLWQDHRVVLVFYRGHWCPYCQHQLDDLNKHFGDFEQKGATIVAVSVDSIADQQKMSQKFGLRFQLYSDPQLAVITKFGVDDYAAGISRPAVFVIEKGGTIAYKRVGDRPDDRPTTDEILAAIH